MNFIRHDGKRRVVVTGGGMLSSLGRSWEEAFANLQACKNRISYMPEWERFTKMNTRLASPYKDDLPTYPRKKIRGMGRVALLSLVATEDALRVAGLLSDSGDVIEELKNGRTGVAYGTCMGSLDAVNALATMMTTGDSSKFDSQTYIKAMPQTNACNLSVFYQIRGRIIVTDTACTSGSQAVGYGYEAVADGRQDIMICGGAEEMSAPNAAIFDTLGQASFRNQTPEATPRCFDKDRDGLVIGEGAGTLILEDLEHAVKRGAKIFCEVAGFATNADGFHITSPNYYTQGICMEMALANANLTSDDIGYVNAHGTATYYGDISETTAVHNVFKRPVPLSSTKSYVGHLLGACGAVESWVTINMMNENWYHPNVNLDELDPQCAPLGYIKGQGMEKDCEYVMSNNFAFGGINTSLIFKKFKD